MLKPLLILLTLLLVALPAAAKNYSLADGTVSFDAPESWPAIMEKTNGDPQFYAFQIRNPRSTETLTRITVTTHEMRKVTDFDAFVKQTLTKARNSSGFSELPGKLGADNSLHYQFDQDGQPQSVRLSLFQHGHQAIVLRCQHPQKAKASRQWLADYRAGCKRLAAQLGD
ncbi:MAG: hypothetical protein WBW92_10115 [Rhodanobacteraceae bacterium]